MQITGNHYQVPSLWSEKIMKFLQRTADILAALVIASGVVGGGSPSTRRRFGAKRSLAARCRNCGMGACVAGKVPRVTIPNPN